MFPKIDLRGIDQLCPFVDHNSVCCAAYYNRYHELNPAGKYLCQCDRKKLDVA